MIAKDRVSEVGKAVYVYVMRLLESFEELCPLVAADGPMTNLPQSYPAFMPAKGAESQCLKYHKITSIFLRVRYGLNFKAALLHGPPIHHSNCELYLKDYVGLLKKLFIHMGI
jgi:hypothetical protein